MSTSIDVTPELEAKVQRVIEEIRPAVQADGGDLQYVRITEAGMVEVRLHGSCVGCPSSTATLQNAVANYLREEVPQVQGVTYAAD